MSNNIPPKSPGKKLILDSVNRLMHLAGLELVRHNQYFSDYRSYIPLQETVAGAQKAGKSVGDYIDSTYGTPGSTQDTIDQMEALGVFKTKIERVCEIGAGSGRYLAKVLDKCAPSYYEVYETSAEWAQWLAQSYPVTIQPTDGMTLPATAAATIDLVHAHKVLPGQPSLAICHYYAEMARVVRTGGKVVFDVVTEECMPDKILAEWLRLQSSYQHYPCLIPKQFTIDFFQSKGFTFDGSFLIPMKPGLTNYLVFTKI
jgi:SAM-dependent methyltransferase